MKWNTETGTSQVVRVFRVANRLTQAQLAGAAGVSRETVCRIERGAHPSATTARKLADALGCDVATLIPREEPSKRETPGVQAERSEANPSGQKDRDASYPSDRN